MPRQLCDVRSSWDVSTYHMVAALQQTERKQNRIVGLVDEAAAVRRSGAVVGGVMLW